MPRRVFRKMGGRRQSQSEKEEQPGSQELQKERDIVFEGRPFRRSVEMVGQPLVPIGMDLSRAGNVPPIGVANSNAIGLAQMSRVG